MKKRVLTDIVDILNGFSTRPGMFVYKDEYANYANMVSGILLGAGKFDDFCSFIETKYQTRSSMGWGHFIQHEVASKDELVAKKILLELVAEFAASLNTDDK